MAEAGLAGTRLLSHAQAAAALRLSEYTARKLMRSDHLTTQQVHGCVLISADAVHRLQHIPLVTRASIAHAWRRGADTEAIMQVTGIPQPVVRKILKDTGTWQ
jgi:hypothetical protein